jgi:hypothetical protein
MARYLPLFGLILCGAIIGCQQSAIRAQAPGSEFPMASQASSEGEYGLYHVTQFNKLGQPTEYKQIASYHLQAGDPVGFHWIVDKATINAPNAHLILEAYAGDHKETLGQIKTMVEKYYWSNTADWDSHWKHEPAVAVAKLVMLQ